MSADNVARITRSSKTRLPKISDTVLIVPSPFEIKNKKEKAPSSKILKDAFAFMHCILHL
jgi:D-arabinose 5-phosphate isomerase GutQ